MKYLVLRSFRSYNEFLKKGTIVDESEIRNPRLRLSERKIHEVVSSSNPVEQIATVSKEPVAIVPQQLGDKIKLFSLNKNLTQG